MHCPSWDDAFVSSSVLLVSAASAAEVERVTEENAVLRQEVERLKQELISAELQHGGT